MSQKVQKPPKVDPKYIQNGVRGGSEAPWGAGPHFNLNGAKWRQKDVKFLLKIDVKITIHFHTPFYTKT